MKPSLDHEQAGERESGEERDDRPERRELAPALLD
jgi:hypothetical protein